MVEFTGLVKQDNTESRSTLLSFALVYHFSKKEST